MQIQVLWAKAELSICWSEAKTLSTRQHGGPDCEAAKQPGSAAEGLTRGNVYSRQRTPNWSSICAARWGYKAELYVIQVRAISMQSR